MRGNFNIFTSKSNIAMKQFFKFMFASMLGVFLSFFLLLVLFLMMVGALMSASTGEKTVTVAENSLLITRFDHPIPERTPQTPFSLIERKSVVKGKSVSVRVDIGGRRIIKKKTKKTK